MKVHVKHRKGKFTSSLWIRLKVWNYYLLSKLMGNRRIKVKITFTDASRYLMHDENQFDWLKAIGSKDGIKTATNNEWIIAYRYIPARSVFQVCDYVRKSNQGFQIHNIKEVSVGTVEMSLPLFYWLPVAPYAGGSEKPKQSFSFNLELE